MDAVSEVEAEWAPDEGFLWKLRQGQLDLSGFDRTLAKLRAIPAVDGGDLPKRLVAILWYMPLFIHWQRGRIEVHGFDRSVYDRIEGSITTEIERLLGTP